MSAADQAIRDLDAALASKDADIGILMGLELYRECIGRDLITLEHFTFGGQPNGHKHAIAAYRKSHAVTCWTAMGGWTFKVGERDT